MIKRIAQFIIKYRIYVLLAMLIVTGYFGYEVQRIQVFTSFADLYPTDHPYIKVYKEILNKFGGGNVITVMLQVKEGDIFNIKTLTKIQSLTMEAEKLKGVNLDQISSLAHRTVRKAEITEAEKIKVVPIMSPDVPSNQEQIDLLKTKVYTTPGVGGFLVSMDGKSALLTIGVYEGRLDYGILYDQVMNNMVNKETDADTSIYVTGYPMLMGWVFHYLNEGYIIFGITFLVITVLLFIYLRNLKAIFPPLLAATISAIWGIGFAGLLGYNLDPLTFVVLFIVTAIIVSHSSQFVVAHIAFFKETGDAKLASVRTIETLTLPALLSVITDIAGFFFICLTVIPLMRKVAFVAAFWMTTVNVTVMVLVPIILSFLPIHPKKAEEKAHFLERLMDRIGALVIHTRNSYILIAIFVIVGVWGFYLARNLKIGDANPGSPLLWENAAYNVSDKKINQSFPGSDTLIVLVRGRDKNIMKRPDVPMYIRTFERYMVQVDPAVGGSKAYPVLLESLMRLYHNDDPKWGKIPSEQRAVADYFYMYFFGAGVPGALDPWVDYDFKDSNVVLYFKDHQGATIANAIENIKKFITANPPVDGITFELAGGLIGNVAAINQEVIRSQKVNTIVIYLFVILFVALGYFSFTSAGIVTIPLIVSMSLTSAVMVLMNIGLNINTLPVVSVGAGVGVDYGIYMLGGMRIGYQSKPDYKHAILTALHSNGRAIFLTATSFITGVVLWYFLSSLKFSGEMSLLLSIIMFANMVAAIFFVPAVCWLVKPKFISSGKGLF